MARWIDRVLWADIPRWHERRAPECAWSTLAARTIGGGARYGEHLPGALALPKGTSAESCTVALMRRCFSARRWIPGSKPGCRPALKIRAAAKGSWKRAGRAPIVDALAGTSRAPGESCGLIQPLEIRGAAATPSIGAGPPHGPPGTRRRGARASAAPRPSGRLAREGAAATAPVRGQEWTRKHSMPRLLSSEHRLRALSTLSIGPARRRKTTPLSDPRSVRWTW